MQTSILSWVAGILSHGFFDSVVPRRDDRLWSCPGWVVAAAALMLVCTFGSAGAECFDYGDYIQRVGGVGTPGSARSVAISETHAYVADGSSGLQVIDITNPASPQIVGSVDTPDYARSVAISNTHAYVADGDSGLQVIDITNPTSPQIVGSVDTPDDARGVAISETHAYVADDDSGLQVIDITNPTSPQIVGSVDTPGSARGVAISETHAYVAAGTSLQVIDITNTGNPQFVGSVGTPVTAYGVATSGTHAYVTYDYVEYENSNESISGLQVVDITNPLSPQTVSSVATPVGWTGPPHGGYGGARGVAISGTHAYVTSAYSLQVIDISDPESPTIMGSVHTQFPAVGVAVAGNYAYVACTTNYYEGSGSMEVIDLTNPASPQYVFRWDTGMVNGVAISGGHAYVADNWSGLQVLPAQCEATSGVELEIPNLKTHLFEAYPNPFNPQTTIAFDFPKRESVTLRVFDMSGRLVRSLITAELHTPGRHEVVWNGRDDAGRQVASGTYFYRLEAGSFSETKRMVLVK